MKNVLGQTTQLLSCDTGEIQYIMKIQYINCFAIPESQPACLYSESKFGTLFKHLPKGFPLGLGSLQAMEGCRWLEVDIRWAELIQALLCCWLKDDAKETTIPLV